MAYGAVNWGRGKPEWGKGILPPIRSIPQISLSPEEKHFAVTPLTIGLIMTAGITGFFVSVFYDSQPALATKATTLLAVLGVGAPVVLVLGLVSWATKRPTIFVFTTDISLKTVAGAFVLFFFLIIAQLWAFTGLPVGVQGIVSFSAFEIGLFFIAAVWILGYRSTTTKLKLEATGAILLLAAVSTGYFMYEGVKYIIPPSYPLSSLTIATDPQLVGLFYTTSAISETFFFQGFIYAFTLAMLCNFDLHNATWPKAFVANGVSTAVAGLAHLAVYGSNTIELAGVMGGFFFINLFMQAFASIDVAALGHILLDLISSLSAGSAVVTGSALAPYPHAGAGGVVVFAWAVVPLLGWLAVRTARPYITNMRRPLPLTGVPRVVP